MFLLTLSVLPPPPVFPFLAELAVSLAECDQGVAELIHTHTAAGSKRRWKSTTVFQLKLQLVGVNRTLQLLKALLAPLFSSRWKLRGEIYRIRI